MVLAYVFQRYRTVCCCQERIAGTGTYYRFSPESLSFSPLYHGGLESHRTSQPGRHVVLSRAKAWDRPRPIMNERQPF